jgi:hypothetical protein
VINQDSQAYLSEISLVKYFYSANFVSKVPSPSHIVEVLQSILLYMISTSKEKDYHYWLQYIPSNLKLQEGVLAVITMEENLRIGDYETVLFLLQRLQHSQAGQVNRVLIEFISKKVRNEIARGIEIATQKISFPEALNIFKLDSMPELQRLVQENQANAKNSGIKWVVREENSLIEFLHVFSINQLL